MLVLTRGVDESITIGDVTVTVTRIRGAYVRLGIEGPRDVPVLRSELLGKKKGGGDDRDRR